MKITDRLRESRITGPFLAAILVGLARSVIWPVYLWLRGVWGGFDLPLVYAWIVTAAYFSFWVWLFVLLARNGKQNPGIVIDAICGGSLLTVAVALHQPPVRAALSEVGFGAGAWVVFLAASGLVLARSVQRHEGQSEQQ